MPGDVTWQLHGDRATLLCGPLRAAIDVRRPARGLYDLSLDGRQFADCEFLAVAIDVDRSATPADDYARGGDLIVRYAQTGDRPFAVGVYWRAGLMSSRAAQHPYVDLVVSVETSLLDCRPSLEARTSLATWAGDVTVSQSASECLARFPGLALSYIEMIHPGDALTPSLTNSATGVELTTRLFGQPLEKGVILRSRLRGMFVPLHDAPALAATALAQFAATPPPLTT